MGGAILTGAVPRGLERGKFDSENHPVLYVTVAATRSFEAHCVPIGPRASEAQNCVETV